MAKYKVGDTVNVSTPGGIRKGKIRVVTSEGYKVDGPGFDLDEDDESLSHYNNASPHFLNGRLKAEQEIRNRVGRTFNSATGIIEKQVNGTYLVKDQSGKVLYECATEEQGEMYCERKGLTCKYKGPLTLGGVK